MVIVSCMFNIHKCMIHHFNQWISADAKMYHTFVYVEHTWSYGHFCTQIWRSVSTFGHGNRILDKLPRPTRVRIRPEPRNLLLGRPYLWHSCTNMDLDVGWILFLNNWIIKWSNYKITKIEIPLQRQVVTEFGEGLRKNSEMMYWILNVELKTIWYWNFF